MPVKYLWFIGKPIAESEKDLSTLKFLISAYAATSTEISFCGYDESFRTQTVKRITQQFGGNSYYISKKNEFSEILIKDFKYYSKPAISDLVISVYNLGFTPANTPIRNYYQLSMDPAEHHTFLVNFSVPSLYIFHQQFLENLKGKGKNIEDEDINLPVTYPLAIVTYEYFDYKENKIQYGSEIATVEFTEDYEKYRLAFNQNVIKNQAILHTVELLRNVASDLEHRNFERALLSIRNHIKLLEKINSQVNDPLILEDITTLKEYMSLILEYINDPSKGSKIRLDLKKRRY